METKESLSDFLGIPLDTPTSAGTQMLREFALRYPAEVEFHEGRGEVQFNACGSTFVLVAGKDDNFDPTYKTQAFDATWTKSFDSEWQPSIDVAMGRLQGYVVRTFHSKK